MPGAQSVGFQIIGLRLIVTVHAASVVIEGEGQAWRFVRVGVSHVCQRTSHDHLDANYRQ